MDPRAATDAGLARAGVWHDAAGLGDLARGAREQDPAALREAARQFEAMFVQQMLEAMRRTVPEDGLLTSKDETHWRDMMDRQTALDLTSGQGFGLADAIVRQLGGVGASGETIDRTPPARIGGAEVRGAPRVGSTDEATLAAGDPERFVALVRPHAERAAARLGVDADVLVAQAALETGWGRGALRAADGAPSFNLFNIKAGGDWDGASVSRVTVEYRDGVVERERARFRAYESVGAAFDDYVTLVEGDRYAGARAAGRDARGYVEGLQRAGYATDPAYADKVMGVLRANVEPLVGTDPTTLAQGPAPAADSMTIRDAAATRESV